MALNPSGCFWRGVSTGRIEIISFRQKFQPEKAFFWTSYVPIWNFKIDSVFEKRMQSAHYKLMCGIMQFAPFI